MSAIGDFLGKAGVFYLATVDGDQPKLRPLGAFAEKDGQVYFGVGTFKDVYRELKANPKAEIVAMAQPPVWLRYTGDVVLDGPEICDWFLSTMPEDLQGAYKANNWGMGAFHLENATAVTIELMGPGTPLE